MLAAIGGGRALKRTATRDASAPAIPGAAAGGGAAAVVAPLGDEQYGPPWNKLPPPGVAGDMFKEMAWKKRQKELKAAAAKG